MPIVALHRPAPDLDRLARIQRLRTSATVDGVAVSVRSSRAAPCGGAESAA